MTKEEIIFNNRMNKVRALAKVFVELSDADVYMKRTPLQLLHEASDETMRLAEQLAKVNSKTSPETLKLLENYLHSDNG